MTKEHTLFTITGPSGSGKSTVAKTFPLSQTIISFTTRKPRPGEIDGKDYYFITKDQAELMRLHNELVECISYNGNYYGYSKKELFGKLKEHDCVNIVTIDGLIQLAKLPELAGRINPIFMKISKAEVEKHMRNRNDTEENIQKRLDLYDNEAKNLQYWKNTDLPIDGSDVSMNDVGYPAVFEAGNYTCEESIKKFIQLIHSIKNGPDYIAIEGGDGAGKSSLIKRLQKRLNEVAPDSFRYVKEPGDTEKALKIRAEIFEHPNYGEKHKAELFAQARKSILNEEVYPAIDNFESVISDRSIISSVVYQSVNTELSQQDILELNIDNGIDFVPNKMIYVDIDPKYAEERITKNNRKTNYLDHVSLDYKNKIRKGFQVISDNHDTPVTKLIPDFETLTINAKDLEKNPDQVIENEILPFIMK